MQMKPREHVNGASKLVQFNSRFIVKRLTLG